MLARLRSRGATAAAIVGEVVASPAGRPGLEFLR
jgi:hypothetical protein